MEVKLEASGGFTELKQNVECAISHQDVVQRRKP